MNSKNLINNDVPEDIKRLLADKDKHIKELGTQLEDCNRALLKAEADLIDALERIENLTTQGVPEYVDYHD